MSSEQPKEEAENSPLVLAQEVNDVEMPVMSLNGDKKDEELNRDDAVSPDTVAFESVPTIGGGAGNANDQVPDGKCLGRFEYSTNTWDIMPYHPSVYKNDLAQMQTEFFAGVTVAFAQVSESVAFAFIAGVPPLTGLHAAWIIGLSLSFFGSRPAMINGATGVRAAVIAPYVAKYGTAYLFYIVITISIYQLLAGLFKLAKLVRLVPRSVMIGFVNGLAIILALGQVLTFRDRPNPNVAVAAVNGTVPSTPKIEDMPFIQGAKLGFMFMHVIIVTVTILLVPKIPKAGKYLPASLIGIMLVTFIEHVILRPAGASTPCIGEVATVAGGLPMPFYSDPQYAGTIPPYFTWETLSIVAGPAFIAAAAGGVEAVMTMEVVNDLTETTNESPNQQLIALSIGNFLSGIFGTMGGGATIGLSVINCQSGANGRYRFSGIVAGIMVFIFVLAASAFIEIIPTASLVGVMVIVIVGTFDWESLSIIFTTALPLTLRNKIDAFTMTLFGRKVSFSGNRKIKRTDAITIILVTVITLVQDLFVAVAVGIVFTATAFAWDMGSRANVSSHLVKGKDGKVTKKIYKMHGALFFASAQNFVTFFTPKEDPDVVEIHFMETGSGLDDYSAIHALNVVGEKYKKYDKQVIVRHLNAQSKKLVSKSSKLVRSFTVAEDDAEAKTDEAAEGEATEGEATVDVGQNVFEEVVMVETEEPTELTAESTVHRRHIVADTINA